MQQYAGIWGASFFQQPLVQIILSGEQASSSSLWYRSYYLGSKLLQAASGTDHTIWGASFFKQPLVQITLSAEQASSNV